ncbi:MAG: type II and III secretion system protein [candidate division NC10 bacterium]|nr:type II and III secretion system protein [candidate division NC10 bacterium]
MHIGWRPFLGYAAAAALALGLAACAQTGRLPTGEPLTAADFDQTIARYTEILVKEPESVEARLGLIRTLRAAGEFYFREGTRLERDGLLDDALIGYNRALQYNPDHASARAAAARVTDRRRAVGLLSRAKEAAQRGAFREAARLLAEARQLAPDQPEVEALFREVTARAGVAGALGAQRRAAEARGITALPLKPVSLRFKDTDIKDVLEVIARLGEVNIFLDEGLTAKRITTYIKDLPLRDAFELLLSTNRLFAKQVGPRTIVVIPDTPAKHQQYDDLVVHTFYLGDTDAKTQVNLLRTILNTRQIFVNEKLNALVVRDTPEKVALAKKLLHANDRGIGEVEIELEILEVKADARDNLGLLFDKFYTVKLNVPTVLISESIPDQLAASTLALPSPAVTLNILKNLADTKTLASPTVRVLDRQKARILIGERRPFQISTLSSTSATIATPQQAGVPAGTIQETRVEFRDVGLKLTLTPTIHLNGDVTVELNFEISSIGAPIGGDLLPSVNTRNLDTFIKVRDGETRLLGGLIQNDTTVTTDKLPFLGDIPLLGRLFSNVATTKIRTDVIISVTPRLVKVVEPPAEDILTFSSGTAMSFEAGPVAVPAALIPPEPPRPGVPPRVIPPAPPVPGAPGAPAVPGVPGLPAPGQPEE